MTLPAAAVLGHLAGLAFREVGEGTEARRSSPMAKRAFRREVDLVGGLRADLADALVADERLGAAVLHDVGDLRRREVPVDRRQVPAGLGAGESDIMKYSAQFGAVDGDDVAVLEAEIAQVRPRPGCTRRAARRGSIGVPSGRPVRACRGLAARSSRIRALPCELLCRNRFCPGANDAPAGSAARPERGAACDDGLVGKTGFIARSGCRIHPRPIADPGERRRGTRDRSAARDAGGSPTRDRERTGGRV